MKKEFNFSNGSIIFTEENNDMKIKVGNKMIDRSKFNILESMLKSFVFMKTIIDIYPSKDDFIYLLKSNELLLPNENDYSDFYDSIVRINNSLLKPNSNIIPSTPPAN